MNINEHGDLVFSWHSGGVERFWTLPIQCLEWTASRSGGAGGQHVNKTASKMTVVWKTHEAVGVPDGLAQRMRQSHGRHFLSDGSTVMLSSEESRDQHRNREICLEKLYEMIAGNLVPRKKRRPTKPSRSAVAKRLEGKRKGGERKQSRSKRWSDE